HLRVAFAKPYDVEYDYDKSSNSYLRTWGDIADTDRNNNKRLAPKNVVVMIAKSEQITLDQDYTGKGLQDPWSEVPEIKKTGAESITGRYNNMQLGDPWYDESGSGDAYFYMNGKEIKGTWKKDASKIDSKLFFYDSSGQEIRFVPGQIWVEILEPGQALKWEPVI
ncbi:MAG: PT repeat-containing protein, partial [uncultured bacterium]